MSINLRELFKDNPMQLAKVVKWENEIEEANQRLENAVNKVMFEKIELNAKVSDRIDILKIVDEGKLKIKKITDLDPNYKVKQNVPHDHDGDGIPDH